MTFMTEASGSGGVGAGMPSLSSRYFSAGPVTGAAFTLEDSPWRAKEKGGLAVSETVLCEDREVTSHLVSLLKKNLVLIGGSLLCSVVLGFCHTT